MSDKFFYANMMDILSRTQIMETEGEKPKMSQKIVDTISPDDSMRKGPTYTDKLRKRYV